MTDYVDLLPIAAEAVDLAGKLMRTSNPGTLTFKGDRDMATEVDYIIEQRVRAILHELTPDIGFLGEEEGSSGTPGELLWALDPIDGTANFIHGIPLCGVSLGLLHRGRSVLGVVDLPFLQTRYSAAEHHGAYANGQRIQASRAKKLRDAIVAIGDYAVGEDATRKNIIRLGVTGRLAARAQRVRMNGSAATDLVWLAEGKIDAVIMMSNKPWDTGAGVAIAREAGAAILDADGTEHTADSSATIGAGRELVDEVLDLVRAAAEGEGAPDTSTPSR